MKPHRFLHGQQRLKQAAAGDQGGGPHPPPLAENRSYSKQ